MQYSVNSGTWTDSKVSISYYGGTNSSPFLAFSPYTTDTSLSFVSIPAAPAESLQIRVTKLWDAPFLGSDEVSVRPSSKQIASSLEPTGKVLISRTTSADSPANSSCCGGIGARRAARLKS